MTQTSPRTLLDAVKHFADPANCREYLVARRWPNGVTCPKCGSDRVYFDSGRNGWECSTRHPQRKFTLKTGTIFEDSPLGFDKWLPVMWMIANCKNGVSSWEVHRAIGVTQKTAWFMLQRIRLAMQDETGGGGKLGGDVEVDETFIGGKARNMHADKRARFAGKKGRSTATKVAVMGLLERTSPRGKSRVRTEVVPNTRRFALQSNIRKHVEMDGSTTIFSDAHKAYERTWKYGPSINYVHQVIDHAEAYARGNVHTNGLESYWSLLKRALRGTYISVEPFHLLRYLDDQAFRFNNRDDNDAERFSLAVTSVVGKRLTYEELTAKAADAGAI